MSKDAFMAIAEFCREQVRKNKEPDLTLALLCNLVPHAVPLMAASTASYESDVVALGAGQASVTAAFLEHLSRKSGSASIAQVAEDSIASYSVELRELARIVAALHDDNGFAES